MYTKLFLFCGSLSLVSSRPLPSFPWSGLKAFNSVYWNKHYVLLSTRKGNVRKFYFNICAFNIGFSLTTFKESIGKVYVISQTSVNLRSTFLISRKNSAFETKDGTCWMVSSKSFSSLWSSLLETLQVQAIRK